MTFRPRARIGIALVAAYAVALQALLLAVVSASAGATGFAALPICANAHAGWAGNGQAGHGQGNYGQDCLDACLTGCCCGASLPPAPPHALYSAPRPLQRLAATPAVDAAVPVRAAKAHRSRAPPTA